MMSLHYANTSLKHYDVIMLDYHNYIPFHYAYVIMLLYVYVCRQTCLEHVCIYISTSILT